MSKVWLRHYAGHFATGRLSPRPITVARGISMKRNPVHEVISRELDNAGIRHTRLQRGKHEAVEFDINGERQLIIVGGSPSDWRAPHNARSHVRRVLRQRG